MIPATTPLPNLSTATPVAERYQKYQLYSYDKTCSLKTLIKNIAKVVANIFIKVANSTVNTYYYLRGVKPTLQSKPDVLQQEKPAAFKPDPLLDQIDKPLLDQSYPILPPEETLAERPNPTTGRVVEEDEVEIKLDSLEREEDEDEFFEAQDKFEEKLDTHSTLVEQILPKSPDVDIHSIFSTEDLEKLKKIYFLIDFHSHIQEQGIVSHDEIERKLQAYSKKEVAQLSLEELEDKLKQYPEEILIRFKEMLDATAELEEDVKKKAGI